MIRTHLSRLTSLALAASIAFAPLAAVAQPYPTQTPTYIPTAVLAPATIAAPSTATSFVVNGLSTVSIRIAGTCTSLAATFEGTNQRTGTIAWTTLPAIPVAGGATVASVSAAGFWKVNASGLASVRVNVSALTASCTISMAGSAAPDGAVLAIIPNASGSIALSSQYPAGSTPITGIGAGTTGAVVGTLAGVAAKTTYICSFDVSAIGGTAAVGPVVVAGLVGGSFTYQASSSAAGVNLPRTFSPCIPASAVNTPITVTTTADGTATAVNVNAHGYQL